VIIRDATPTDIPDVLRLIRGLADYERVLHRFTATEADLHAMLFGAHQAAYAVLIDHEDTPAAGIALFYYKVFTFTGRRGIFLEDLFVEPAHRGAGLGLALLRHLAARAVAEQCLLVEWHVLNWNQPAIDFYEKIGATQVQDWQVRQLAGSALAALAQGASHHG
jgi:GNAT superfamily N-acetyltransferase